MGSQGFPSQFTIIRALTLPPILLGMLCQCMLGAKPYLYGLSVLPVNRPWDVAASHSKRSPGSQKYKNNYTYATELQLDVEELSKVENVSYEVRTLSVTVKGYKCLVNFQYGLTRNQIRRSDTVPCTISNALPFTL